MKAKFVSSFAFALALMLHLVPGQATPAKRLQVVATTTDLKGLIQEVGGDRVAVLSIASPNQDPHTVELKPGHLVQLRQADLVVRIGLDHEPWLKRASITAPVLDVSRGVRLTQTETPRLRAQKHAHTHAFGNPHYWLDPENAKGMTAVIVDALVRLRPQDRAYFESNRAAFVRELDARMQKWRAALAPYKGTKLVVVHDTWTYFAERFDMSIVAAAEPHPGVPPSASELAKLFMRMRDAGVKVVIAEPSSNPALVKQIAERTGSKIAMLMPSISERAAPGEYLSLFDQNVSRLVQQLQ